MPLTERFKKNILFFSLLAAVVTIPLYNNLNSIALVCFVGACALQSHPREWLRRLKRTKLWVLPTLYFLVLAASYAWDSSGGFSIKYLERYATLLFIPLAIAVIPPLSAKWIRNICMSFVGATVAICLACLVLSYIEYGQTGDYRVFYYHYLSGQMELNAIFLSSYCLASVVWLLYFWFGGGRRPAFAATLLIAGTALFLSGMIFLLSSKLNLFLLGLMLMVLILYIGRAAKRLALAWILIGAMVLGGVAAVYNLSYLRWRLDVTELKEYRGEQDNNNGLAIRVLMWESALELIEERPLLGYGLKGARLEEVEKFREKNFVLGYTEGYHSHNQFLESTLMIGIPGLVLFTGMLVLIFLGALRSRNLPLLLLAVHFLLQSLIGSPFEVQQELVFFIFFMFFFYYHPPFPAQSPAKGQIPDKYAHYTMF